VNKTKLAAGAALGLAVSAVLGVFAGIMLVHGPANPAMPPQSPAAVVQQLTTTTTTTTTTTADTPPLATTTTTAPPVVQPKIVPAAPAVTDDPSPVTTTTQPPLHHDPVPGAPLDPANSGLAASPIMPTTTTPSTPNCMPDGTGTTVCN
jgi:hypothetical protein